MKGFSSLIQAKVLVPMYRRIRDPRLPDGRPLSHQRFPLPLLASPLHHHWEKLGMDRRAIVLLMWSATLATAAAGVLAAAMPQTGPAAVWIGIGATTGAAFWVAAMWLRPAFLTYEGDKLVLAHGRPVTIGPIRLYRRLRAVGGPDTAAAAAQQGLLRRPMNALELAERLQALGPASDRTGPLNVHARGRAEGGRSDAYARVRRRHAHVGALRQPPYPGPACCLWRCPARGLMGATSSGLRSAAGAAAALCGRADPKVDRTRQVVTDDALGAFEALAGELRSGSDAAVVGVTGSNGKTTTKQAIAAALRAAAPTLATGPKRERGRRRAHDAFAVGTGRSVRGDRDGSADGGRDRRLLRVRGAKRGRHHQHRRGAHLGLFGSIEAVAEAKAELLAALPIGSPVVLHADDDWTPWMRTRARGPVTTFGRSVEADVRVASRLDAEAAGAQVKLAVEDQTFQVRAAGVLPTVDLAFGAALATAMALGVDPLTAIDGMGGFEPAPHRLQLLRSPGGSAGAG